MGDKEKGDGALAKRKKKRKVKVNYVRLIIVLLIFIGIIAGIVFGITKAVGAYKEGKEGNNVIPEPVGASSGTVDNTPFTDFYFYEADKKQRYDDYREKYPGLSSEDVVWRVNMNLDMPFYSEVVEIKEVDRMPLLVNKYRKFADSYEPANLVNTSSGNQMTAETKAAYEQMRDEASAEGIKFNVTSAYRAIEHQKGIYNKYLMEDSKKEVDTFCARAGHSEHHTGRSIDIVGPDSAQEAFPGTPEAEWIAENAWKYGFIVRYTEENADVTGYTAAPWHLTYVSKEVAQIMKEKKIGSLEEYCVKYVNHMPPEWANPPEPTDDATSDGAVTDGTSDADQFVPLDPVDGDEDTGVPPEPFDATAD